MIGLGASGLDDYATAAATEQSRVLAPDAEPEKGFYYRSDHFNFAKKGVPAFDPDSGVDFIGKPPGYGTKKRHEYTANDYHKPSDQVKPDWDLAGAAEDGRLFLAMGYRVANADKFPEWKARERVQVDQGQGTCQRQVNSEAVKESAVMPGR